MTCPHSIGSAQVTRPQQGQVRGLRFMATLLCGAVHRRQFGFRYWGGYLPQRGRMQSRAMKNAARARPNAAGPQNSSSMATLPCGTIQRRRSQSQYAMAGVSRQHLSAILLKIVADVGTTCALARCDRQVRSSPALEGAQGSQRPTARAARSWPAGARELLGELRQGTRGAE